MVNQTHFSIGDHCRNVKEDCVEARKARLLQGKALLEDLGAAKLAEARRIERRKAEGIELSIIPNRYNGNSLLAEEFFDNLRSITILCHWTCQKIAMVAERR